MRVTIGELLGHVTAQEGAARERDLYWQEWERQHAAQIDAERARFAEIQRRLGVRTVTPPRSPRR